MKRIGLLFTVIIIAMLALGFSRTQRRPTNTKLAVQDTIYVGADSTYYSQAFYPSDGVSYCLLVEADDTTSAGFSADSACVDLTLLAGFHLPGKRGDSVMVLLGSHCHPDSNEEAGDAWPFGASFVIADSLHIDDMDSGSVFIRTKVPLLNSKADTVGYYYNDEVTGTATRTDKTFGAYEYYYFNDKWVDYTPAIVLQVRGCLTNKVAESARYILRWYQMTGVKQSD